MQKKLLTISIVLLVAITGYSFYFIGTPAVQRAMYEDNQKLYDLRNINCVIKNYFYDEKTLPNDMETVRNYQEYTKKQNQPWNQCRCYTSDIKLTDSKSRAYEYLPKAGYPGQYEICAEFNTDSEEFKKNYQLHDNEMKSFKKGRNCFAIKLQECKEKDK